MKKKILVVAAHPDDETLGCGGLISNFSKKGFEINTIILGEGTSCRYKKDSKESEIQKKILGREKSCKKALKVLGGKKVKFFNLPCGRFDSISLIDIAKIVEKEISLFNPDTIITHSNTDVNNDHKLTFKAVLQSTRPSINNNVNMVLSFEILSSTERNFTDKFNPNFFVKLSKSDINKKKIALRCFKSEFGKFPFPRSDKGIEVLANYRGMQCGSEHAEAYRIIRKIYN